MLYSVLPDLNVPGQLNCRDWVSYYEKEKSTPDIDIFKYILLYLANVIIYIILYIVFLGAE
jgi:hypothetical protein